MGEKKAYLVDEGVLDGRGGDEDEVAVEADDVHALEVEGAGDGLGLQGVGQVLEQHDD